MDADVLVRPSQAQQLLEALEVHNRSILVTFRDGSSFQHAATLTHPRLAPVDVHRAFPGIGITPEAAFDSLWRDRTNQYIAGVECTVPSITARRLILLLNAARGGDGQSDRRISWDAVDDAERLQVRALAQALDAEVALAATIGELGNWKHHREHDMWLYLSTGTGTPFQLWQAKVRAERDLRKRIRLAFRLIFPTRRRMSLAVGHTLTQRQLVKAYVSRIAAPIHRTKP